MTLTEITRYLNLDEAECLEIVQLFVAIGTEDLKILKDAIEKGDQRLALQKGHALKGSALNLGIRCIADNAEKIERLVRSDRTGDCSEALQQLSDAMEHMTIVAGVKP